MSIYLNSLSISLPKKVLTNFDFEKTLDTTDEWIRTRTGIENRHILDENENPTFFAVEASKKALQESNINPEELTHIIVATCSPEMFMPSMACLIAGSLNIENKHIMAFDFNAACSGYVYGMELIRSFCALNKEAKILFVTAEFLSRKINYEDRSTCVLFGDAASACIFTTEKQENSSTPQMELLDAHCYTDGNLKDLITIGGGTAFQAKINTPINEDFFLKMQGREVYKNAVRSMTQSCKDILEKNNLSNEEIRLAVPHQANMRIIEAVYDKLQLPEKARFVNVQKYGNTSASSIPLALNDIYKEKLLKKDDILLLTTFGGGLTWASGLFKVV